MPSQKPSTASARPCAAIAGSISPATLAMKASLSPLASGGSAWAPRKVVRTETGRSLAEPPRGAKRLFFIVEVEAVARLDLDRRDAFGDQRVEPRQRLAHELVLARRTQRLDRRDDAAACPRHFLVGRAGQPHLELVGAVAGMDEMGVAIDQARRDPAAFAVDDLRTGRRGRGKVRFGTGIGDFAAACGDGAALDDAQAGQAGGKRRKPGVAPDARPRLRCLLSGHDFSVPIGVDMYIHMGEIASGVWQRDALAKTVWK